jgi:tetrahydromethanopterin S-methyltransferase subunit A
VCWPALAINALSVEGDACPGEAAEARAGWPPLPGSCHVLRYHAPVAVCTLTDEALGERIASAAWAEIALVGTMQTENLGIERLMQNTLANPNLRFVVLCGADSRQAIGHLPGQSLVALARSGVDERMRIIGAQGKRPVLRNVTREAVDHFRHTVEIVDMIGETSVPQILGTAKTCAARNHGPAEPFAGTRPVVTVAGYLPESMISDPAGYFVVFPDCRRRLLMLEHYRNDGALDVVIEGRAATELYIPAIEKGLVSRLDHAAYWGKELARAEQALLKDGAYVQDAAPERQASCQVLNEHSTEISACGCGSSCRENKHA